ncbi:MAG: hypothetical protein CMF38_06155 [Legionellaceae bacterium]|nr:hypothetical protein [Legionellaceae bacterium]HAF88100.1 hypothetical protein [Legionellales bacterium]HCA90073.1 hypothetical protein [Legionellales bacterium]|tara:strand:- start:500 stop:2809 length:2310 start_codon:yes stop_codon:yes gene_type:complete
MPQPHSELFGELNKPLQHRASQKESPALDNQKLTGYLKPEERINFAYLQAQYSKLTDVLREINDAQFGIISTFDKDNNVWQRDATNPLVENRPAHNAARVEINNMLLRYLSRMRAIDYALTQKFNDPENKAHQEILENLRPRLLDGFIKLHQQAHDIHTSEASEEKKVNGFKGLEKKYDGQLIDVLHEANLTQGCVSADDASKLLGHYRNLASVLEPARTLVTLTYDKENQILHRETSYPVTKKTAEQQTQIEELAKEVNPNPVRPNSQTTHLHAMQEANRLYASRLRANDSMLPAQTRKTHAVGVKNAFIVKVELIRGVNLNDGDKIDFSSLKVLEEDTLWLARAGSPVYVGQGASEEYLSETTHENLTQILKKAQELQETDNLTLHTTILNTNSSLEHQNTIVRHTKAQTEALKGLWSYVPTNFEGKFFHAAILHKNIKIDADDRTRACKSAPVDKIERVRGGGNVALAAAQTANFLSLTHCASGQDRTGTVVEKAVLNWTYQRYKTFEKELKDNEDLTTRQQRLETQRALGGNAAEIASHLVPGSPGMKKDSRAKGLFQAQTDSELYRQSATTNKENSVSAAITKVLQRTSKQAHDEFEAEKTQFEDDLKNKTEEINHQGRQLVQKITRAAKKAPNSAKTIESLTQVLRCANACLSDFSVENYKNLQACAKGLRNESRFFYQSISVAAVVTTFITALVVALSLCVGFGILGSIPSGGASIALAVAASMALTSVASTSVASFGLFKARETKSTKFAQEAAQFLKPIN